MHCITHHCHLKNKWHKSKTIKIKLLIDLTSHPIIIYSGFTIVNKILSSYGILQKCFHVNYDEHCRLVSTSQSVCVCACTFAEGTSCFWEVNSQLLFVGFLHHPMIHTNSFPLKGCWIGSEPDALALVRNTPYVSLQVKDEVEPQESIGDHSGHGYFIMSNI